MADELIKAIKSRAQAGCKRLSGAQSQDLIMRERRRQRRAKARPCYVWGRHQPARTQGGSFHLGGSVTLIRVFARNKTFTRANKGLAPRAPPAGMHNHWLLWNPAQK